MCLLTESLLVWLLHLSLFLSVCLLTVYVVSFHILTTCLSIWQPPCLRVPSCLSTFLVAYLSDLSACLSACLSAPSPPPKGRPGRDI